MTITHFTSQAQALIRHFSRAISHNDAALFIGSGFSMNAEYLDTVSGGKFEIWTTLIDRACKELGEDTKEFTRWYTYPEILEFYRQEFRNNTLIRLIHEGVPDRNSKPGKMHFQILDSRKFTWSSVITTNIDTLIEKTLEALRVPYKRLAKKEDFAGGTGLEVIKLHGTYDDPGTYIFTENEYNGIELTKPLLIAKIRQVYAEKSCLFIGYSLRDPDFRRIVQIVRDLVGVDLRLSIAIMPSATEHEKTYWKEHGVRILSSADLIKQEDSIDPAEFVQVAITALAENTSADSPKSLSQLGWITRLYRLRELSTLPTLTTSTDNENAADAFLDSYASRREIATSKLFLDYFPRETMRILLESYGGDQDQALSNLFSQIESRDLQHEPPPRRRAIELLCNDIANMILQEIKMFGLPPRFSQVVLEKIIECTRRTKQDLATQKVLLGLQLVQYDAQSDKPMPEEPYSNCSDLYVRTLPRYLNILRLAEIGYRSEVNHRLISALDDIQRANPLWHALIVYLGGNWELAENIARSVLSASYQYGVLTNLLAAQFVRDIEILPEMKADMYLEASYFMSLAHENGIPTEDLDIEHVRKREIAVMLEISAKTTAKRAIGEDPQESAVPVFRGLLMRHRILGIPYKLYQRAVLGHWLQIELDGPRPVDAIIEYGSGAPTDCISKTNLAYKYRRTNVFSLKDWMRLQDHAVTRLIQSIEHRDIQSPNGFWGKLVSVMMPYLTTSNLDRLLEEANTGGLGSFFTDWKIPGVGRTIVSHDKKIAIRYLATRRILERNAKEVSRILWGLDIHDVDDTTRKYIQSQISASSSFNELVSFARFFAGEPEASDVVDLAKSAHYYEKSFSGQDLDLELYRTLDLAYANYVVVHSGFNVGAALSAAHDLVVAILDNGDDRRMRVSAFAIFLSTLATPSSVRDVDIEIFKRVIAKLGAWDRSHTDLFVDDDFYHALISYAMKTGDIDDWVAVVKSGGARFAGSADTGFLKRYFNERGVTSFCHIVREAIVEAGLSVGVVKLMLLAIKILWEDGSSLDPDLAEVLRYFFGRATTGHDDLWLWLIPPLAEFERVNRISEKDLSGMALSISQANFGAIIPTRSLAMDLQSWRPPSTDNASDGVFVSAANALFATAVERGIISKGNPTPLEA